MIRVVESHNSHTKQSSPSTTRHFGISTSRTGWCVTPNSPMQEQQQYVLPILYGQQWYQTALASVQQGLVTQTQKDYTTVDVSSQNLDDQEVKRERRRQSNREAARRSRKRKQDEMRRLAVNVEELQTENEDLKKSLEQLQHQLNRIGEVQKQLIEKIYGLGGSIDDLKLQHSYGMQTNITYKHVIRNTSEVQNTTSLIDT
eukprot:TRINITY_DN286_c0_g1_i2.p1 TRINITY_DN286_c0_g1~~TRINITY_DN286_c0_g1_i2.p1  ORF type:complete len:201 (-),score=12.70 TRINITY_DN286_c0_g1_i2:383-985(-)